MEELAERDVRSRIRSMIRSRSRILELNWNHVMGTRIRSLGGVVRA